MYSIQSSLRTNRLHHRSQPKVRRTNSTPTATSLHESYDKCFVQSFLQNSHDKSPQRTLRTRLPPKATRPSLQNEHSFPDFLQKPHVKSSKLALRATFTRQVSTTGVSFDHLQKSHFQSEKRAFRARRRFAKINTSTLQNERVIQDFGEISSKQTRSAAQAVS